MADPYQPTHRTTLRRLPGRAAYDRETVHAILDEALVAHLAVMTDLGPRIVPTTYARVDEVVYVHGSAANHLLRSAASEVETCMAVTLLDGLVLARSAFHHSMNYRSAVVYGWARRVTDDGEKRAALDAVGAAFANQNIAVHFDLGSNIYQGDPYVVPAGTGGNAISEGQLLCADGGALCGAGRDSPRP